MRARHRVRELAQQAGLRLVDQTKFVTAVSELARNTIIHGGGGHLRAGLLQEGARQGVYATFEDNGPGIPDIAMDRFGSAQLRFADVNAATVAAVQASLLAKNPASGGLTFDSYGSAPTATTATGCALAQGTP